MNDLLLILGGVALGTYFAENVRGVVPVLDPNKGAVTTPSTKGE